MEYTEDEDQETQVNDENDDEESWMYTHSTRGMLKSLLDLVGRVANVALFLY
jgi:hypothetical protein